MNFLKRMERKVRSYMENKAIESMTEFELNSYLNKLQRAKDGNTESQLDDKQFLPQVGTIQAPIAIIQEIVLVREALKRLRRTGATAEEKKAAMKRYMGFECARCHEIFNRTGKVTISGADYCSSCAKDALNANTL